MSDDVVAKVEAVHASVLNILEFAEVHDKVIEHVDTELSAVLAILRAEPSRSSPDPDFLAAAEHVVNVWAELRPDDMVQAVEDLAAALGSSPDPEPGQNLVIGDGPPETRPDWRGSTAQFWKDRALAAEARLGSSPDLTGLDAVSRYVALHDPDGECNGKCSAWAALRALAARLPPAPETDPSQVER